MSVRELGADGIGLRAGGRQLLEGWSMRAGAGELVGLAGPSGSGKTALLQVLAGYAAPDGGAVTLDGVPAVPWRQAVVGAIPQVLRLPGILTVAEGLSVALRSAGVGADVARERTGAVMAALGLGDLAPQPVSTLSGGQRQRVAVAQALVRDPDIVLADDPTTALDAGWREAVMDRITATARAGAVVVVASNDPETLARCDRLVTLGEG